MDELLKENRSNNNIYLKLLYLQDLFYQCILSNRKNLVKFFIKICHIQIKTKKMYIITKSLFENNSKLI